MADDNTIATLESHIRALEQEVIDTKKMINRLLTRDRREPRYPEQDFATDSASAFIMRKDKFYGQPLSTCVREYLKMRHAANLGPADAADIYSALCRGGFKFETENEENRKKNLKVCLTKNTSLFHKLPGDPGEVSSYGLTEWYGIKAPDEEPKNGRAKKGRKAKSAPKKTPSQKPENIQEEGGANSAKAKVDADIDPKKVPTTMRDALRLAVKAASGEFTKQALVDWIESHYPALKAEQKKSSVFSMIAGMKEELSLETSHAGIGKEPHRFRKKV